MKGFRVWGLATSLIFMLLFFLYPVPYTLYPSRAADSTPSANIQSELDALKKEIASKAAILKSSLKDKLENKAYVGNIKSTSKTSITLASSSGPKLVNINLDTVFENQTRGKRNLSLQDLADDSYIAALGDIDETGVLTARKIILLPKPKNKEKTYIWGKVLSADGKLATVVDRNGKNVGLSSDTNLSAGDFIIATGVKNENEVFGAGFVYVIPQGAVIKPKKLSTPSASLKVASPSSVKKP